MATTIAKQFTGELRDWRRTIAFYDDQIAVLTVRLGEVVRQNSIPNLSARVEEQQDKLNVAFDRFAHLQGEFGEQESALKTDSRLIDDSVVSETIEEHQRELRQGMLRAEKACVDATNSCEEFLWEVRKTRGDI
jgi:hypothetical protein